MSIKNRYNLLYFIYTVANCCLSGFVAIFLQFRGVSNTSIGIVTGLGSIATIVLAPMMSNLVIHLKKFTLQNIFTFIYLVLMVLFTAMIYLHLPEGILLVLYTIIYAFMVSTSQFLQLLATDLMQMKEEINFGLARGLGSAAWATSSLVFSFLIDVFDPTILGIGYVIFNTLTLFLINTFPSAKTKDVDMPTANHSGNMMSLFKQYPIYIIFLTGFSFMLAAASSLGTYLINIVTSLGGTTSFFGIATFLTSFSELPFMALTPRLMKRFKTTQLMVVATISYLIRNILICIAPNLFIMCVGMVFQGLSYGIFTAVLTYYVMYNMKQSDQIMGQTIINVMTIGGGAMLGNVLGGYLQDAFGLQAMYVSVVVMTIIGALIALGGYWMSRMKRHEQEVIR